MRERTLLATAGGLLLGGGGLLGREGLSWVLTKGFDRVSAAVGAEQVTWLESLPWWNIAGVCSIAAGLALTTFAFLRGPRYSLVQALALSPDVPPSVAPVALTPVSVLQSASIFDGQANLPPNYRARFSRNGRDARFYVEFSFFFGGYGGGWTEPTKLLVRTTNRFAEGEAVTFPLMRSVQTREGARWQFGEEMKDGFPVHGFGPDILIRGRVTTLMGDDTTRHCYFIGFQGSDMTVTPKITGEHIWAHEHEWEGRRPPNGEGESLFVG